MHEAFLLETWNMSSRRQSFTVALTHQGKPADTRRLVLAQCQKVGDGGRRSQLCKANPSRFVAQSENPTPRSILEQGEHAAFDLVCPVTALLGHLLLAFFYNLTKRYGV